jgi:hypothetical protein
MHTTPKQGITRRKFLQNSLALGTALSLESLLGSCATLREARQEVRNQQWSCNPILPIPKEGCYVGFYDGGLTAFEPARRVVEYYRTKLGKVPAFVDISDGKLGAKDFYFPKSICESYTQEGILPSFKYGMTLDGGVANIVSGRADEIIELFAKKASDFGEPFIFVPFKEMNWQSKEYWNHGEEPPKTFVKAWRHMHKIFEDLGANRNTIWAIHYLNSYGSHRAPLISPKYYYPGDEYVDIVAFTVCNRVGVGEQGRTFGSLIWYDYDWLRTEHKKKPIAILEMSQSNGPRQHKWIKDTYSEIKNDFPAIKFVQWYEVLFAFRRWVDDQAFSENPKSVQAMKEVLSDPYYIGGPLKFLEKYKG